MEGCERKKEIMGGEACDGVGCAFRSYRRLITGRGERRLWDRQNVVGRMRLT